ncbi:PH domain-containing protein [Patulibacter sp. NPDC049589]|uniref:PH domain-containing protein n=1 Tax=Patulibacter sp. NPDC049589 TaxID=3154731 RepID=UPI00342426B5
MTSEGEGPPSDDGAADLRPEDERRLHPAWVLTRTVAVLRGLVPALIGLAVGLREWALPAGVVLVVLVILLRIAEWRVTKYAVVDGGLRLRSGILARRERVVPASRISALDTSRGLVQRAFGLVSLEVQTAGGGKHAELKLDALTYEEAERLRAALGHAARTATAPEPQAPTQPRPAFAPPAPGPPPVYAATGRQLVIAALTGPQLGLVGVLVASLFSQLGDAVPDSVTDRVGDELSGADAMTIVVLVVVGILFAAAVSVVGTVLAFAEFTVVRDERRLRVRRGLITERTGTIPLDRIHGVRIVEGLLRRPLGYATVQVEVAGYRGDDEITRTLVPLVHRRDLPALLERMLPEVPWPAGPLTPPPPRARRRYWTIPVLLSVVPTVAAAVALPGAWSLAAILIPPLGLALGDARFRGAGWSLGPETLAVRHQLLARTTLLSLARRAQHVDVRDQPFQRRADLATFDVVLATGRHGAVRHLDAGVADLLQRTVASRTSRNPSPVVRRKGSLDSAAPPE